MRSYGKTLRNSYDKNSKQKAIIMVSAWARESGLILAQTLESVVRVEYLRQLKNGETSIESRYFITSLSKNAEELADYIRGH